MRFNHHLRIATILAVLSLGPIGTVAVADDSIPVTLVFLADSNLNGAGSRSMLKKDEEFKAVLTAALAAVGTPVTIASPGFKEFSEDGASWICRAPVAAKMLAAPKGYAVMLELGANDCGDYKLGETHANLDLILTQLQSSHIPVLAVGTSAYDICRLRGGTTYTVEYAKMFVDLAAKYGALYYPDFKEGVNGHAEFLQPDADHANGQGNALVATKMLPVVKELIARAQMR